MGTVEESFEEEAFVKRKITRRTSFKIQEMPRVPAIPHQELKEAIFNTENCIDLEGKVPGPRHECWEIISKKFDGRVTPKYIYQYVHENRHNCFSELKHVKGIKSPQQCQNEKSETDSYNSSLETNTTTNSEEHVLPQKSFHLVIPANAWLRMKPVKKKYERKERRSSRIREILPPLTWEPILIKLLWEQHRLPCPYSFKRSYVFTNFENSGDYIKIQACCNECNSTATGRILRPPIDGEDVPMIWRSNDSRNVKHSKKVHLKGPHRTSVATALKGKSVSAHRRVEASNTMDMGDKEPPNLYSQPVLRKAKQEQLEKEYTNVPHGVNEISSLLIMKHKEPYAGSIHDIAVDKFSVHYYTPAQMVVYSGHCKKHYIALSIDATGSLVRKLTRINGCSGHIFLYEGVISTGNIQLPVMQMLSEKHDANSILYWINEFQRSGGPSPQEVVIDNSAALKSAIVRSFCQCVHLNDYIGRCFLALKNEDSSSLPSCFLRLDVAHLLSAAAKWNVWSDKSITRLKDFYLRCLGLLIQAVSLIQFETTLKHVLIVSLSQNEGKNDLGDDVPMEQSLHFLSNSIKDSNYTLPEESDNKSLDEFSSEESKDEIIKDTITEWLNNIKKDITSQTEEIQNGRLNPYYSPAAAEEFLKLARIFVLWSAVMVPLFQSPFLTASSTAVESDFSDLKNNILKGLSRPMSIPKFISVHIDAIEGSCRIAEANKGDNCKHVSIGKQRKISSSQQTNDTHNTDEDLKTGILTRIKENQDIEECREMVTKNDENESEKFNDKKNDTIFDLNEIENWRGLGKKTTKIRSTYLEPLPEFDAAVKAKKLKQPKQRLMKNGNLCRVVRVKPGVEVLLRNTCAFDSLAHVIAAGYILHESLRPEIDTSSNLLLKTAQLLATVGATKETYLLRALALVQVIEPKCTLNMPKRTHKKTHEDIKIKDYDCTVNAPTLSRNLLREVPSVSLHTVSCTGIDCKRAQVQIVSVLDTNMNIILDKGVSFLEQAITSALYIHPDKKINDEGNNETFYLNKCKPPCEGVPLVRLEVGKHILIDIDYLSDKSFSEVEGKKKEFNRPHSLNEFPKDLILFGHEFVLVGIVAHIPGHYIAYSRYLGNTWNVYNDLTKDMVSNQDGEKLVSAHLLFYVKQDKMYKEPTMTKPMK